MLSWQHVTGKPSKLGQTDGTVHAGLESSVFSGYDVGGATLVNTHTQLSTSYIHTISSVR